MSTIQFLSTNADAFENKFYDLGFASKTVLSLILAVFLKKKKKKKLEKPAEKKRGRKRLPSKSIKKKKEKKKKEGWGSSQRPSEKKKRKKKGSWEENERGSECNSAWSFLSKNPPYFTSELKTKKSSNKTYHYSNPAAKRNRTLLEGVMVLPNA